MSAVGIYALDQNSITGWAVERIGGPILCGFQAFPRTSPRRGGHQGLTFARWLHDELASWQPERVIYEQPLPPFRQGQTHTATITMGFAYLIDMVCSQLGLPVSCVPQQTWCKAFTGSGKRDKNTKGRVIAECHRRGFEPPDDNAADALGIAAYAIGLYHPDDAIRNASIGNLIRARAA